MWLLITKLDKAVLKLKFLVSLCQCKNLQVTTQETSVLQWATDCKNYFQQSLEQMIVATDPTIFAKLLAEIISSYEMQRDNLQKAIKAIQQRMEKRKSAKKEESVIDALST